MASWVPAGVAPARFHDPAGVELTGWLWKQGEWIRTWRRRWFVLKQAPGGAQLAWFKSPPTPLPASDAVTAPDGSGVVVAVGRQTGSGAEAVEKPRGIISCSTCLSVKGAEEVTNKPFSIELSTRGDVFYLVAEDEASKEAWINAVGKAIVQSNRRTAIDDYDGY